MNDLVAVFTIEALVATIAAGLVFGAALPSLFRWLVEDLIPEPYVAILNAAAGVLVPFLAIPLGATFYVASTLTEVEAGGPWLRVVARFVLYFLFVLAVTAGDLMIQRWRLPPPRPRDERIERVDREAEASERRVTRLRASALEQRAQRMAAAYAREMAARS